MQLKVTLFLPVLLVTLVACESSAVQVQASAATATQIVHESAPAAVSPESVLPSMTDVPEQAPGFNNANLYPGLQVVYIREGDVWLWADGVGSRQLTDEHDYRNVAVAPDGRRIAFSRGNEIWVMGTDGTGERQLLSQAYLDEISVNSGRRTLLDSFGWYPGGNLIFFSTFQDEGEYSLPNYDLHLVEIGNPAPYQWLAQGQGGRLFFSPDGRYLAMELQITIPDIYPSWSGTQMHLGSRRSSRQMPRMGSIWARLNSFLSSQTGRWLVWGHSSLCHFIFRCRAFLRTAHMFYSLPTLTRTNCLCR
jgi:hypothetical protein